MVIEVGDGFHDVAAGGRRVEKLLALAQKKRLAANTPIMCLVVTEEVALMASLTENVQRLAMHPADEFVAFQELVNAGIPLDDVAANFGVTACDKTEEELFIPAPLVTLVDEAGDI
ncbi:hypothetical protein D3C84_295390 [compost metagenome]